jgi:hypothetical protein
MSPFKAITTSSVACVKSSHRRPSGSVHKSQLKIRAFQSLAIFSLSIKLLGRHDLELRKLPLHKLQSQIGVAATHYRILFRWAIAAQIDIVFCRQCCKFVEWGPVSSKPFLKQRQIIQSETFSACLARIGQVVFNNLFGWAEHMPCGVASVLAYSIRQRRSALGPPSVHGVTR